MKKFLVIGNPIKHSLSPELHNYWFRENNIEAVYDKKELNEDDLGKLIFEIKNKTIHGFNITVPFKKSIIPHLEKLTPEAEITQSVNTVYQKDNKIIGDNTDIYGFMLSIKNLKLNVKGKKVLILGAGGVVSSIIFALNKMNVSNIIICNRTKTKAYNLKKTFRDLTIIDWGEIPDFDLVINATSIGLKENDNINLDFSKVGKNKFFYDLIYNPEETNFLKTGKELGSITENGKLMFIYQAQLAFEIWHGIKPLINNKVIKLLRQ